METFETNVVRPGHILLEGVTGSVAYGLNDANSDIDMLGVFVTPTLDLFKLAKTPQSVVSTNPDFTYHEAEKFVRLVLKANPPASELLWLEKDSYTQITELGQELLDIRSAFLSADKVKNSYMHYAASHLKLLSKPNPTKTIKNALHMARTLRQGRELYRTGKLSVLEAGNATWLLEFSNSTLVTQTSWLEEQLRAFECDTTVLPQAPDLLRVEAWLCGVRLEYLQINL
jgi:hypothetical protein